MTVQATNPILPFPGGIPADSPVAAPFEAQPGEPITIESLEKGRFLERVQQQIDHAVATLALGADGSSATVTAKVTLTKSGFIHNIKTAVATAAKTEKLEGRVTATVNEAGQLTTFDDKRAAEKPAKKGKGKAKKTEETPPAAEAPVEEFAAPVGDTPSGTEALAVEVFTLEEAAEHQGVVSGGVKRWVASATKTIAEGGCPIGWEPADDGEDGLPRLRRPRPAEG